MDGLLGGIQHATSFTQRSWLTYTAFNKPEPFQFRVFYDIFNIYKDIGIGLDIYYLFFKPVEKYVRQPGSRIGVKIPKMFKTTTQYVSSVPKLWLITMVPPPTYGLQTPQPQQRKTDEGPLCPSFTSNECSYMMLHVYFVVLTVYINS